MLSVVTRNIVGYKQEESDALLVRIFIPLCYLQNLTDPEILV